MLLEAERRQVVDFGKKMIVAGLTTGTGGNISVFDRKTGLMAISPSGMNYDQTRPEDVVITDLSGKIMEGIRKPSSELALHLIFYQNRPDINAVVHTHSTYATVLATLGEGLPASSYMVAVAGLSVPCAPYASFGTLELAQVTYEAMREGRAALMQNHGMIAVGKDPANAFNIAEQIEQCCKVYVIARSIGEPVILPEDEMQRMCVRFDSGYGQIR